MSINTYSTRATGKKKKKKKVIKKKLVAVKSTKKKVKKKKKTTSTSVMKKVPKDLVLAITYDVWISGTKLGIDKKQCINSISIKETVEGADIATIGIQAAELR